MSEDIKSGNSAIPPRLTIKNPGQNDVTAMSDPAASAITPPASPENNPAPDPVTEHPLNKKKTSRISLDQVTAEPGASATVSSLASKTIRLAPAMTGQVSATPFPSVGKALTGMLVSDEAKRKTSRISLDSVLPQLEATSAGGDAPPKTIRIKRPTISVPSGLSAARIEEPAVVTTVESNVKSQTTRVDIPQEAVATEGQQTQKKTIKIRRAEGDGTEGRTAPRTVNVSRNDIEAAVPSQVQVAVPHWSFVLVATAAVVTMCVMLYVLMAQAYPSLGWSLGG